MIDIHLIIATVMASAFIGLAFVTKSRYGLHMSPDGEYYFKAGRGELVPMPYCLRPLVPLVCGENEHAWYWVTYAHIALQGAVMYVLCILLGLGMTEAIAATACFAMSKGTVRSQAFMPALVDAHAMSWAMMSACLVLTGFTAAGIAAAIVSGFVSEKSPFFAAIFAWSPIPLFALPAMLAYHLIRGYDTKPTGHAWLDDPYKEGLNALAKKAFSKDWPVHFCAPFGVAILGLFTGSGPAYLALIAALAPTVRALDYNRLAAWGLPLLLVEAVKVVPMPFLPMLPIVHQYIVETLPSEEAC